MYHTLPFVITSLDNKVILSNTPASKKYRSISLNTDMGRYICSESKELLNLLSGTSSAIIKLCRLQKTKFAFVSQTAYLGTAFRTYIFLDADARETALLDLPAKFSCDSVKKEQGTLQKELLSVELYEKSLRFKNTLNDAALLRSGNVNRCRISDIIREVEQKAYELHLFGCSVDIEYGNIPASILNNEIFAYSFVSFLLFLLSAVSKISLDKKIVLIVGYYDDTLSFKIKTQTNIGGGQVFRDRDIFETGLFDEDLLGVLSVCSYLSGAFCGKLSVSLERIGMNGIIYFDHTMKLYDKRPAGFKADPELEEE